jgi:ribosomal-protein-alanine N-acetyltransferase
VPRPFCFENMTAGDLGEVMEIERLAFDSPWTTGLFLHELKLPFSRLVVARTSNGNRKLIGYACWWRVGDEVHIHNLAVHPDYRRSGVGRALVQLLLDEAVKNHVQSVSLEVRHDNAAARGLYRSFGFTERGVRKHYYGRGEDAVVMTRELARPDPGSIA